MARPGKIFDFHTQNRVGDAGARIIEDNYPEKLQKLQYDSPIGDYMLPDGRILEMKTDTYPLARTPNFFMEFYSNTQKGTYGGPWRAYHLGADIFLYLYLTDKVYYEFHDLQALVAELEKLVKENKTQAVVVQNRKFTTTGFKVDRRLLAHLYTERKIGGDSGSSK